MLTAPTANSAGISVIVPVHSEAAIAEALIARLSDLRSQGAEIIVVDGHSRDATAMRLADAGFAVLTCPRRGRGHQLALGAQAASHDHLVFLHADTILPQHALRLIQHTLSSGEVCWGRFDVQIAGTLRGLNMVAFMMNWRSRLTGIATGDQAMFMTRTALTAAGGVPEQVIMEDIELSQQLRRLGAPACLKPPVITSGRRWQRDGLWPTIWLMWRLRWRYWRGVSADTIAQEYA